jgi:undecaprenyl-diphosphatase
MQPRLMLGSLLERDARLSKKLRVAEQPGALRTCVAFLAHSGDSWFWLLGLAVLWGFAPPWEGRAALMALGIVMTAVLVLTVKFTVRRRRPEGEWGDIYRKTDPHSFPSGHAARAFLLAAIAAGTGPLWFAVALAVWAPLVALARVAMGVHYISDILAGLALGIVMGLVTLQLNAILQIA